MRWSIVVCMVLATSFVFHLETAWAQARRPVRDIGTEVRGLFAAKCAACHGADLPRPKGRFGYVLDLSRVAANPEMVIPGRPPESELWMLVQHDEMPPVDSPYGALTVAEKDIVRTWIVAGAPDATGDGLPSPAVVESDFTAAAPLEIGPVARSLNWLGKFHLVLLHFPIALVLAAGLVRLWGSGDENRPWGNPFDFVFGWGALAAVPTAALGWFFAAAGNGVGSPQLLMAHRWLGTTTAVWLVIAAVWTEGDARRGIRTRIVWLLASGVLLILLTAHLGGLLSRGADFFDF